MTEEESRKFKEARDKRRAEITPEMKRRNFKKKFIWTAEQFENGMHTPEEIRELEKNMAD